MKKTLKFIWRIILNPLFAGFVTITFIQIWMSHIKVTSHMEGFEAGVEHMKHELVETGFRGTEVKLVSSMIQKLDNLETETDRIQVQIRSELVQYESELPPIDVMFMYKVIDAIGDLGDRAQQVGSRLELLLAR